jgi:GR25 family glycosyltransferase involved in LPS biosynthesis
MIDKIIYINLEARTDRNERILNEFKRLGFPEEKIQRFSATSYQGCPNTGCLLSHANVLEMAYDMNLKNVLILEDDFVFIEDADKVNDDLKTFFDLKLDWDVVMLTTCAAVVSEHTNSLISRVSSSGNGAGYLVNRSMMLELSTLFKSNVENLFNTKQHWIYQNDILWKTLMPSSKWFMFNHYLGYQQEGYSDLSQDNKIAIIPQIIGDSESSTHRENDTIQHTSDSIVNTVIDSFIKRSNLGLQKYGTTLDRDDLKVLDWIQHAQEEHMDAILYLEKLKREVIKNEI